MSTSNFEQEMEAEIRRRVEIIESEDYDFGVPFSKGNWILVGALFVISLILIIIGGTLAY